MTRRKLMVLIGAATTAVALAAGIPTLALATSPTPADTAACASAWNSGSVYTGGMEASYQGDNWTAKWWTEGDTPGGSVGVWTNDGACGSGGSAPPPPPPTTPGAPSGS